MKTYFDDMEISKFIEERFSPVTSSATIMEIYRNKRKTIDKIPDFLYGNLKDFDVAKVKSGKEPNVIFINGFLTADMKEIDDWEEPLSRLYPDNSWFHLRWNSKQLMDIGASICGIVGKASAKAAIACVEKKIIDVAVKEIVGSVAPFLLIDDIARNPWFQALYRAKQTGEILAEYIRNNTNKSYILLGHSLGARVIFYALRALSDVAPSPVMEARLLGGAVGVRRRGCFWGP